MEELEGVREELARVLAAKERRRVELGRLPFPEKVEMVIRLQEMAAPILRARGKMVQPWRINPRDSQNG
jgi:hypothetical protein